VNSHDLAELAQTLFEEIGDAAFIAEPDTLRLVDLNPMAQRLTRVPRETLLKYSLEQIFRHEGDGGLDHLRRALQTTRTFHSQEGYQLRREDDWIPVNLTLTRLHALGGQLGLILARDVTDRTRAEEKLREANANLERRVLERTADLERVNALLRETIVRQEQDTKALRQSEERFRNSFDNTAVAMVLTDIENRFVRANASFAKLLGYTESEIHTLRMQDVTHADDVAESLARRERLLAGEGHFFQVEKKYLHKDGHSFWGLTNVTLLRDEEGRPYRYIAQVQDIDERKVAEHRLRVQHAVSTILSEASDLEAAAPDLLRVIRETTGWDVACLWIVDREAGLLRLVGEPSTTNGAMEEFRSRTQSLSFQPGAGLPGRVWMSGETVWIEDVTVDGNFPRAAQANTAGLRGGIGFPILCKGERHGVIELFSRQSRPPERTLLELFDGIGRQIGQFLERTRAEQARSLFRALLDSVNDPIEVIEPTTGRILDANRAASTIHGYTREEYLALRVPDIDLELVGDGEWDARVAELRRNGSLLYEGRRRRRDGHEFPVEVQCSHIRHDREYLVAVVRDITERKRGEASLRQAREHLAQVIASSPVVLVKFKMAGDGIRDVDWIGDNLTDILGHRPADALAPGWWSDNTHPDDRAHLSDRLRDDLGNHERTAHEFRFRHADGTYRWTRGEFRLLRDASHHPVGIVGSWSDITDRKALEDQFRQSQKMEAIGRLAGGVAHDFNNLLTIINGYGDLLFEGMAPADPNRAVVREIVSAGERAASLTRQLLAFSRKAVIEPRVLSLAALTSNVHVMLRRIVGEDIALTVNADPDSGHVKVDSGQLEQVILNLVVNARDAMPRGGKITIEVRDVTLDESYTRGHPDARPGPHVLLAVTDTGTGMDAATMARIFEPFFSTKGEYGTGLGLATVHGIIRQSGGHVAVYSELGYGTTFKVYLPRVEKAANASISGTVRLPLVGGNETVLIVEDEDGVRSLARYVLANCGYQVLEAHDGAEALRVSDEFDGIIHLVVTDVVLPKMGGKEIAERISRLRTGIKVLFLSGYTDDAVMRHGILEAQVAFLQKPFTPASLAAAVRAVLDDTPIRQGP
jgi:two-component system cell cycle sensor histidine kinase/response regulator CckA